MALQLPTFTFSENSEKGSEAKRENPFCAFPGCSRRPVKVCEWDYESKICDEHQYPSFWDRDSNSYTLLQEKSIAASGVQCEA